MFNKAPAAEPAPDVIVPADAIPISHIELDLVTPVEGWASYLASRDIAVVIDDVGRLSISREDAKRLFDEHRENQVRAREVAARREREAIEADQQRRAQLWGGAPAVEGVSAAALMLQANRDAQPKRVTPLQHALANTGELVFHPIRDEGEDA